MKEAGYGQKVVHSDIELRPLVTGVFSLLDAATSEEQVPDARRGRKNGLDLQK